MTDQTSADQAAAKTARDLIKTSDTKYNTPYDRELIGLAHAHLALQQENERLIHGLNVLVNCQSALPRAAMREAAAELLNGKTIGMADQSAYVTLKQENAELRRALKDERAARRASVNVAVRTKLGSGRKP